MRNSISLDGDDDAPRLYTGCNKHQTRRNTRVSPSCQQEYHPLEFGGKDREDRLGYIVLRLIWVMTSPTAPNLKV